MQGSGGTASLAMVAGTCRRWLFHEVPRLLSSGEEENYREPQKGLGGFMFYENLCMDDEIT